jgi:DNA-binding PadR family transcriptional regulator
MLILKTLALEPMHGCGIGVRLEHISKGVLKVNAESLFPALRRLERDGLIVGEWHVTENSRRGKYYALIAQGGATLKRETKGWEQENAAIGCIISHLSESSDDNSPRFAAGVRAGTSAHRRRLRVAGERLGIGNWEVSPRSGDVTVQLVIPKPS